jgi:hypothetical protein
MNIQIKNVDNEKPKNGERIWLFRKSRGYYSDRIIEGTVHYSWHDGEGTQYDYEEWDEPPEEGFYLMLDFVSDMGGSGELLGGELWWSIDDTFKLLQSNVEDRRASKTND